MDIKDNKHTRVIDIFRQYHTLYKDRITKLIEFNDTKDYGIMISFPYNQTDVQRMHQLDSHKYHSQYKVWTCSLSYDNMNKLYKWGFKIDPRLMEFIKKPESRKIKKTEEIKKLGKKLYPFQEEGVKFIESTDGRTLLADEMGLGKTIQTLAWLTLHPELRPAVIVCPASAKLNWSREANIWMDNPELFICQSGAPEETNISKNGIIIINYDILSSWGRILKAIEPKVLILDECHYIKNNKAKRTKATKVLAKGISHVIAISGTPVINRPVEIYNAVKIIDQMLLPDLWEFGKKFCGLKHNGFGWDWSGATNTKELNDLLTESVMIRRLKKDVLKDLPDKTRAFVPIELDNWNDYYNAELNFIEWLREKKGGLAAEKAKRAEHLVQIEQLKQIAVHGKIKQIEGWIEDFLESDQKLVVFCIHQNIIDRLMKKFNNVAVKVDGRDSGAVRQKAIDSFQESAEVRLFIGNIKAAGIAINLTAANHVAIIELPWTPGDLVQAEDRCHRIDTKGNVTIYYLLAQNTIEEKMAKLLDKKMQIVTSVLDGKDILQKSMLTELMNQYLDT